MKEKLLKLAQKLGFASKMKENKLTSEEWAKFAVEFKKEYGIDILKAVEEANKAKVLTKEHQEALAALMNQDEPEAGEQETEPEVEEPEAEPEPDETAAEATAAKKPAKKVAAAPAEKVNLAEEIKKLNARIEKLGAEPEKPAERNIAGEPEKKVNIMGIGHTKTHVLGFKSDFFARTKPWNEIMATRKPREDWSNSEQKAFKDEFNKYGEALSRRIAYLQANNLLGVIKDEKLAANSVDYTGFDSTGYGDEYVVRRQDALIAYIRSLPSVSSIFPVQYGVQNKMEMTSAFLTEFSQAWQSGKVYKGAFALEPEIAKVDRLMFKHKFSDLKELESEYIGYLNREGSDPMKWTFIEWLMMQTMIVLHNEQEARRVRGYRIEPTIGTAGHHMFGSDGIVKRLRSYVEDFKLEPIDLHTYTSSTILAYVEAFVEAVNLAVPSMRGMYLYMNEKHVPWFKADYRTKYGTDFDFNGNSFRIINYNIDGIVPVPNMGPLCLMWITMPNNLELYELQSGSMEKLYFQQDLEELIVASWWHEGTGAYKAGRKYASAALLAASQKKYQYIFLTDAVTELAANATTCDASKNDTFRTVANGGATAITDISNKEEGVVYRIELGHLTNATTIAKAGLFSNLTEAWIPTVVGNYLEVYWNATTSKFVEVRYKIT